MRPIKRDDYVIRSGEIRHIAKPRVSMASRLVCADCGGYFGAKTWHSTDAYRRVVWRCNINTTRR